MLSTPGSTPISALLRVQQPLRLLRDPLPWGKLRSRRMEDILEEARALEGQGCRSASSSLRDITRYGVDLYGERRLPGGCCSRAVH